MDGLMVCGGGQPSEIVHDLKAAATDALRKASTLFGLGLELYERDEGLFQGYQPRPLYGGTPAPAHVRAAVQARWRSEGRDEARELAARGLQSIEQLTLEAASAIMGGPSPGA